MSSFRIAHLSDLHFAKIRFDLSQFFSKRWVGNWNLLLRRKREFDHHLLKSLPSLFLKQKIDLVLISGDLSCTSLETEFLYASAFLQDIEKLGIQTVVLPGNHDHYTKKAYKEKAFYQFFGPKEKKTPYDLKEDGLQVQELSNSWWLITLDTTLATPLFCCHGVFSKELEKKLEFAIVNLPQNAKIILANHFPISLTGESSLQGEEALLSLLRRSPQIKLYLHGHTHKRRIDDQRALGLPVITDAGSASHRFAGSWNLIQCLADDFSILPFTCKQGLWAPQEQQQFTWKKS